LYKFTFAPRDGRWEVLNVTDAEGHAAKAGDHLLRVFAD
jgi:hypothetical protein